MLKENFEVEFIIYVIKFFDVIVSICIKYFWKYEIVLFYC